MGGTEYGIDAILTAVKSWRCNFVEVTGGEPLEQEETPILITRLCDEGYTVAIETGGHVDISSVDSRVTIIMDLKCPGSGMQKRNRLDNLDHLKANDEVKFVIGDEIDYRWALEMTTKHRLDERCYNVLFSPAQPTLSPTELAEWILRDAAPVRLQLQLHKILWDPNRRGV